MKLSFRTLYVLGFLGCVSGLLFALYLQHFKGYEPCPMCIFQRIAMIGAGIFFAIGALHAPRRGGRWVYAILTAIPAAIGAGIAGRQVWLQSLPEDQVPVCGPTLDYLLHLLPVTKVVALVLKGDGSCAKIDAQWLGLTLPAWSVVAFVLMVLYALLSPVLARSRRLSDF